MKFCENCGTKLDDNALFCEECGTKQEPVEEVIASEKVEDTSQNQQEDVSSIQQTNRDQNDDKNELNSYIEAFEEDEVEIQDTDDNQAITKITANDEAAMSTSKMIFILLLCSPFTAGIIADFMPSFLEDIVFWGSQIYALTLLWTKSGWNTFTKSSILLVYALYYYIALTI